ncbi:A24 family peptidase [Vibrio sp. SCSIO 43137]|uniref:A24 family peptidase n=1 Tax=Vibrio sp. SCSIO 43137 TaxID=3021011 RepID=UPI002307FCA0|nr:A24 family peptidase [Vibrio sp. SCSIO 43137]WCE32566.1 A24 family peptidase [Vibrio sp. SCSIO 43137]
MDSSIANLQEERLLAFYILCVLSVRIIFCDIKTRRIPDVLSACVLLVGLINAWISGFVVDSIPVAFIVFIIFFVLWFLKVMGGGDVKLIVAFTVGIAPQFTLLMLCITGLLGGIQLGIMYLYQQQPFTRGIPYGVPIVISGLFFSLISIYAIV